MRYIAIVIVRIPADLNQELERQSTAELLACHESSNAPVTTDVARTATRHHYRLGCFTGAQ
jgi:hypothetical protein